MNNMPYSALGGVMTADVNERTKLNSYRFIAVNIAQFIVGGFTLPLVAKFGQGNNAKGWQITMGLWATICVVLFIVTFLTTRERIQPDPKQKSDAKTRLQHSPQDRSVGGHVHPHTGPLHRCWPCAAAHSPITSSITSIMTASSRCSRSAGLVNPAAHGVWSYLLNTFGLVMDSKSANVSSVGFSLFNMSSQFVTVGGVSYVLRFSPCGSVRRSVAIVGFLAHYYLYGLVRSAAARCRRHAFHS
jgi:GPH family glycoside/pentoside/hexuronide:cation symporter